MNELYKYQNPVNPLIGNGAGKGVCKWVGKEGMNGIANGSKEVGVVMKGFTLFNAEKFPKPVIGVKFDRGDNGGSGPSGPSDPSPKGLAKLGNGPNGTGGKLNDCLIAGVGTFDFLAPIFRFCFISNDLTELKFEI